MGHGRSLASADITRCWKLFAVLLGVIETTSLGSIPRNRSASASKKALLTRDSISHHHIRHHILPFSASYFNTRGREWKQDRFCERFKLFPLTRDGHSSGPAVRFVIPIAGMEIFLDGNLLSISVEGTSTFIFSKMLHDLTDMCCITRARATAMDYQAFLEYWIL